MSLRRVVGAEVGTMSLMLAAMLVPGLFLAAETNDAPEQIPALQPPRGEISPGFWELHGAWVVVGGLASAGLIAALVWYLCRPKPEVPVPPEIVARKALEQLHRQPEDGVVLSRVSQVMRHYAADVFGLPPGELTTTELCQALAGQPRVGPDLATALSDFLRQCDERKFAPRPAAPALGAVARALQLIEAAQARLAQPSP